MSNPYESPGTDPYDSGGQGPNQQEAMNKVMAPSIIIMIAGIVGVLCHILSLVMNMLGTGIGAAGGGEDGTSLMVQGISGIVGAIIGFACDGVVIYGALQMKSLKNYGLSMAAAIIALLPCISCGCFIGLVGGIWGIVVLNDPVVKASFR